MKNSIYILALLLIVFNCSKSDDKQEEPCFWTTVFISDNCDCNSQDFNCGMLYFINEEEYNRLLSILNTSTEQCIYINSFEGEKNFEGYLINLNKSACPVLPFT